VGTDLPRESADTARVIRHPVRVDSKPSMLVMSPEVDAVFRVLSAREPIFHRPELGTTRSDFEAQTVSDYWEVGASGTVYWRDDIWPVLEARYGDPHQDEWEASDFFARQVGSDCYLLTYVLQQGARITRRATVWRRTEAAWEIVYHQGTIVDPG